MGFQPMTIHGRLKRFSRKMPVVHSARQDWLSLFLLECYVQIEGRVAPVED